MYSIIEISGGIGKSIMATAVISGIKQKHPERKVLVITAYPEVFLNNPEVYRVFKFGSCPYFYNDYVKNKDTLFFCNEPYRSNSYLRQDKHLIESWCNDLNVPSGFEPKLYLTPREIQLVRQQIRIDKPLMIFQPFGGVSNKYSWNRDIPPFQAEQIASTLKDKFHIVQLGHDGGIRVSNCEYLTMPIRNMFCLISMANVILGIDSCVQHAAKALNKNATVCWVTNSPFVFGYDSHRNIMPNPNEYKLNLHEAIDGYFHEHDFTGSRVYDFPFKSQTVFDINEIITETISPPLMDNFIDDYFDKIYYINLEHRQERLNQLNIQLKQAGILTASRMPGTIISEEDLTTISKDTYNRFHLDTIKNKDMFESLYIRGALGCRNSHLNCIKDAKANGYKKILILEDDLIIDPLVSHKFRNTIKEVGNNWDMLYLGGDYQGHATWQASSYALDANVFDFVINQLEPSGLEYDFFCVEEIQKKYKWYRIDPPIMTQYKNGSDIPTEVVNVQTNTI